MKTILEIEEYFQSETGTGKKYSGIIRAILQKQRTGIRGRSFAIENA